MGLADLALDVPDAPERLRTLADWLAFEHLVSPAFEQAHPQPSTLHPAPYTLHPQPYTLNPQPYTLHPDLYTLNPVNSTLNPKP